MNDSEQPGSGKSAAAAWRVLLTDSMRAGRLTLGAARTRVPALLGEVRAASVATALDALEDWTRDGVLGALCGAEVEAVDVLALGAFLDGLPPDAFARPVQEPPRTPDAFDAYDAAVAALESDPAYRAARDAAIAQLEAKRPKVPPPPPFVPPPPPSPPPKPAAKDKTTPEAIQAAILRSEHDRISDAHAMRAAFESGNEEAILAELERYGNAVAAREARDAPIIGQRKAIVAAWLGFAEQLPSIPDLEAVMREGVIPAFNRLGLPTRMCEECGTTFAVTDGRGRYCTDECGARVRNRGRAKVGGGLSAAEAATRRREKRLGEHMKNCANCKKGRGCDVRESIVGGLDALDRFRANSGAPDLEDPADDEP